jgi:exosome complex component RRP45
MAAVREGATYSASQKAFALERAVSGSARADGRGPEEIRQLRFVLGRAPNGRASATVHLGDTKALAVVTGEVVAPFLDRPTEGQLLFQVDISAMAEPGGSAWGGRRSALAVEAARIIERGLRDSQALDTEALCIIAGERVWSIRVDVKVLDLNGNAIDAASLAAIAALHHYRRPG